MLANNFCYRSPGAVGRFDDINMCRIVVVAGRVRWQRSNIENLFLYQNILLLWNRIQRAVEMLCYSSLYLNKKAD